MSTHSVNIIEITEVRSHNNAERLEIVPVNGWQAVVKKGDFKPGDKAIYIEPDYTVPTALEPFAFLAKDGRDRHRLKAVRLRGVLSYGLLIHVPEEMRDLPVGTDVMSDLEIERYEPPVALAGADELPFELHPNVYSSKFDVEGIKRYGAVLKAGEEVIVTEKIHGANARYLFSAGTFYIGSRSNWLKSDVDHPWKIASDADPRILAWCEANEGAVLYGEIYGAVQSLKYGLERGQVRFAAFAILRDGDWQSTPTLLADDSIPTVPMIYRGPFHDDLMEYAEHDSTVPGAPSGHMREGIVIVPATERRDETIGRVIVKHISNRYWESVN